MQYVFFQNFMLLIPKLFLKQGHIKHLINLFNATNHFDIHFSCTLTLQIFRLIAQSNCKRLHFFCNDKFMLASFAKIVNAKKS